MTKAPDGRPRRVVVIDYGVNNVGSVLNMLRRLDVLAHPAHSPDQLDGADALILPGVGAFDTGVRNLRDSGFFEAIRARVLGGVPILGICLGMQLLTRGSEEGSLEGLGLIPATTHRFVFDRSTGGRRLKVPHMGWNEVEPVDQELFAGFDETRPRFYFLHSYHVVCVCPEHVAARCEYGLPFHAAIRSRHVFGVQFHPEKSHRFGTRLLGNFLSAAAAHA